MLVTGPNLRQHRQKLGLSQAKLAELCGISQHLLSAFELEKANLPDSALRAVDNAISNEMNVSAIVRRTKRYRNHRYADAQRLPERIAKATRNAGNKEYIHALEEIATLHQKPKRYSAISLFSGCGGFSLGFSAGGFGIKGFLELEPDLRAIYRGNFPDSFEIGGDITHLSEEDLKEIAVKIGPLDAIIGGPPCQGFSLSGKRCVDDPRNTLFRHYLRVVDATRPSIAVLENVRLLTSMKSLNGTLVKDDIRDEFQRHGYRVQAFEINAKNYGVPQHRERVLFIAVRSDLGKIPDAPDCTHGSEVDLFSQLKPCRTFADACSDLEYLESGESSEDPLHKAVKHPQHVLNWLWNVAEGRSAHDNDDESKRPLSGYNTTYKRQVWNEPASTVQTTFGMISGCRNVHPIATRSLTIREAARIQSFPDSFQFSGSLGAIRTGIGNAVPPLLAYRIALHVAEIIQSCKSSRFPN